ncbi:hypothetical protein [Bartonella sp. 11B]|nr:hypothetical protein [Bartonella sp. 11B]AQX23356.1 hypothetical protein Bho11B_013780 [Bartonella sp. 11B]
MTFFLLSLEKSFLSVGVSSIFIFCLSFGLGGYVAGRFSDTQERFTVF